MIDSRVKAVFFDAGGTLLHPYPSVGEIYCEVAKKHGAQNLEAADLENKFKQAWLKRDGLSDLASHSNEKIEREWWRSLVWEVFQDVRDINDFEIFFDELYEVFGRPEVWKLYPGTADVLASLKERGMRLAIISNWDSRLFQLCDGFDLTQYFEFILASAVFGAAKPSEKIFEAALEKMSVTSEEAIHVGDSVEDDIHGAQRVGIGAVLINRHPERTPGLAKDLPNTPIIHDLSEFL